jgi:ABC-2 type transport system permease protein|tara:strand:- start:421 stop:1158 length:738 start_codon:yes stop_codon:yes gene_type:complete
MMHNIGVIFRRELASYFSTPLAYVFIVIFLALAGTFTFYIGSFFARGQADLESFFYFHPWLYLFLIPAVAMRLWAEERKTGTIELLMTLPVTVAQAVIGKFLAAWFFIFIALGLTFPIWITVNYLGNPDNGVIFASYFGSLLMAGAFLAIGSCVSGATKNQVIAFIMAAAVSFLFLMSGLDLVVDFFRGWLPGFLVDAIASMSFLNHFTAITRGVIDLRDLIFFGSLIALSLFVNVMLIDLKKAE